MYVNLLPTAAMRIAALALAATITAALSGCASADPTPEEESIGGDESPLCTQTALCIQGYHWSSKSCRCVADKKVCSTDADCTLVDDYCTGCDCRALGTGQRLGKCSGPGVRCLVEPCAGHTAACVSGACVVR